MEYAPANTGDSDTTTILFRFIGYWVWARINQMSEGGAGRDVIAIDWSAIAASIAA